MQGPSLLEDFVVEEEVLNVVISSQIGGVNKNSACYARTNPSVKSSEPPVLIDCVKVPNERMRLSFPRLHPHFADISRVGQRRPYESAHAASKQF